MDNRPPDPAGSGPAPAARLRLILADFEVSPMLRMVPGARAFLAAFQGVCDYARETDARLEQIEARVRGLDEVPAGLPELGGGAAR